MALYLRVADFVSTERGGGEQWRCEYGFHGVKLEPILRFGVRVAGADSACRTPKIAALHSAKELATSCKSPFV